MRNRTAVAVAGLFACVVGCDAVSHSLAELSPADPSPTASQTVEPPAPYQGSPLDDQVAYQIAVKAVEEHLGAASADFPSFVSNPRAIAIDHTGEGQFQIRSYVDAEYDVASPARKRWNVVLMQTRKNDATAVFIQIGDVVVHDERPKDDAPKDEAKADEAKADEAKADEAKVDDASESDPPIRDGDSIDAPSSE